MFFSRGQNGSSVFNKWIEQKFTKATLGALCKLFFAKTFLETDYSGARDWLQINFQDKSTNANIVICDLDLLSNQHNNNETSNSIPATRSPQLATRKFIDNCYNIIGISCLK
jgi:hypothetical protein